MATETSYQDISTLKKLFAEAGENGIQAISNLADILNAAPSMAPAWPELLRNEWKEGTEHVFENVSAIDPLSPEQCRLLRAMLNAALDTPALRDQYVHYFKCAYPRCANPSGIMDAIGLERTDLLLVSGRMMVFDALQIGLNCWDAAYGLGTVKEFNERSCDVTILQERERQVKLQQFLDKEVVVKKDSPLAKLIAKQPITFPNRNELNKAAISSVVTLLPASPAMIEKMLVPAIYSPEEFSKLIVSASAIAAEQSKGNSELNSRWDYSRSLVELEGRLAKTADLEAENLNLENVQNLLTRDAARADMASRWANVVAILCKNQKANEFLTKFLQGLADKIIVWKDMKLFVETTDKLPSKQVPAWMALTKAIAGDQFLLESTIQMPYRLWPHAEQLFSTKEDHQRFVDRIFLDFKEGKPTADHYSWLWKASKSEQRSKYLSDSYLLFKTLHKDLKGNYLKSQRNIHKLLMDDVEFQKTLMRNGELDAITNLVSCVKHMPLLDSSEKQSVLVKIVRIYPEARSIVEENASAQATERQSMARITSIHSYLHVQEELASLINEKIPANTAAIEEARSRGDLSENSEYKYAKEQQRLLGARRNELERTLATCKPIDFAEQDVNDIIIPGSIVSLRYEDGTASQIYLLGLFDTDSEKNWFSYESPMGKVLMSHKVGDKLHVPSGKEVTVTAIDPLPEEILDFLRK